MATESILDKHENLEVGGPPMALVGNIPNADQQESPTASTEHDELKRWIQTEVQQAEKQHIANWRDVATQCYRFVAGDQLDPETRRLLKIAQRPDTAFNELQKYLRYVSGLERRSPQALIYSAQVIDDTQSQAFGEHATNCYEWAMRRCSGHFERSRAFEDMLIGGLGWTDTFLNRQHDPAGMIEYRRISPLEMLWPDCADDNLRTTRWRARETRIDKDEAIRRWPDHELLIKAQAGKSSAPGSGGLPDQDVTRYILPYIQSVPIDESGPRTKDKRGTVRVLEFQYYNDEDGWAFADPVTGEETWMATGDFGRYRRRLQVITGRQRPLDADHATHRIVRVVYLLDRRHFLADPQRLPGDRFTLNCMTGHYDEHMRVWYGFVRPIMDPQRYANKAFNQVLEILATNAKGGWLAQTDAFTDQQQRNEFRDTVARPGTTNFVAPEAIEKKKIIPKSTGDMPAASMTILQWCIQSMQSVTGLNASAMGGDQPTTGDMPALTMRQQQQAGMVLLSKEFDALSRYRIEDEGPTIMAFLSLMADGRLIRVGGPQGQQTVRLIRNLLNFEYDLFLDDTEHDPTLRQHYTQWILQLGPTLIRMNMFVPAMLDYLPFPVKVREQIKQGLIQQQQMKMQAAMQGIPIGGRGTPRDPKETAAHTEKLLADAAVQRARAATLLAGSKRDLFKTILEGVQSTTKHGLERDRHTLERERMGLERDRHTLDRGKAHVEGLASLLQATRPQGGQGG